MSAVGPVSIEISAVSGYVPAVNSEAAPAAGNIHETQLTVASLGLVAEHLSEPLYAKSANLTFVLANSSFCSWVGRSRESILGRTAQELFGPMLAQTHEQTDRDVLAQQLPVTAQERFLLSDGSSHERPVTKLPLADANGNVTHVISVVGQAGESAASAQQLEQELERYAQERTRALRDIQDQLLRKERLMVLGQLAAGLAHQIRNPLGAIANALALVRRQLTGAVNPIVKEALQIASDEIWEANRIIGDLLEYARIRPPTVGDARLYDIIRGALDNEPMPDRLEIEIDVGEIAVAVDERQIREALRNLIRNAREAMPGNGKLTFRGKVAAQFAELRVEDTGEGVADAQRALLFEPLVTSKPLGIGLGLPTARALVMNQGGTLDCVESLRGGACFLMRLPLHRIQEEEDADR
ncbi:MAG TPA: PAS domain-containing sensor histidine kinase [Polyangiaceae bacterium]|jgi:PAS domain S-box-containing protein|nr:PAS domain-containing sensor histidine kinase [Polyangiaceae bacterium]